MAQQAREQEEMGLQNDQDIDAEIASLGAKYERKLRGEREEGARLKGENGIMRKKFNTLNKDIEDNKSEISRMRDDEKKLHAQIAGLEKEIGALRKEVERVAMQYIFWERDSSQTVFRWLNGTS